MIPRRRRTDYKLAAKRIVARGKRVQLAIARLSRALRTGNPRRFLVAQLIRGRLRQLREN